MVNDGLQSHTGSPQNAFVQDGILRIVAQQTPLAPGQIDPSKDPKGISFFVDDNLLYHVDKPHNPDQDHWPFAAVGGAWGGQQGVDTRAFAEVPQEMLVDYVRVYQRDNR